MTCDQVWTGIIIPLISAAIGGGITMWGVIHTIKNESRKKKEEDLERIRPFLVLEDVMVTNVDFGNHI